MLFFLLLLFFFSAISNLYNLCFLGSLERRYFYSVNPLLLGEGDGNPLQYSCLENSMMKEPGRLQSMVSQSQTQLSNFTHSFNPLLLLQTIQIPKSKTVLSSYSWKFLGGIPWIATNKWHPLLSPCPVLSSLHTPDCVLEHKVGRVLVSWATWKSWLGSRLIYSLKTNVPTSWHYRYGPFTYFESGVVVCVCVYYTNENGCGEVTGGIWVCVLGRTLSIICICVMFLTWGSNFTDFPL